MRRLLLCVMALCASRIPAQEGFVDPRSQEVLRLACTTGVFRSDMTLFGNGTLRLFKGEIGSETMTLSELDPDALGAYVRRLQAESLDTGLRPPPRVDGTWTEDCVLTLDVDEGPVGTARFGAFDSQSLSLSRLVTIARELVALSEVQSQVGGLSSSYVPQRGDVIVHRDGSRYRVRGMTSDGLGVELVGIEQPLTIYIALETLPGLFMALEE